MAYAPFVPLRVFSSYTMLDGAIDPAAIASCAAERGFPAAAITDRNGLYGAMAYAEAAVAAGVQPVIGTMLAVARPDRPEMIDWLALYAQDAQGYANLCRLVSQAHLDRPLALDPHVPFDALEGRSEGLLALTAGGEGALARLFAAGQDDAALAMADRLSSLFGDRLFVELARRGDAVESAAEAAMVDLAYARGLPLVATNPACYAEPGFRDAHDALLCMAAGVTMGTEQRPRTSPDAWLKSAPMMQEIFADLPEALTNTLLVARRTACVPPKRKPILPSLAGDQQGEAEQLRRDGRAGLEARLADRTDLTEQERAAYAERLEFETDVIIRMGFPGYFLIVADFIKWAKDQGIPVGPGRGSGAGSVVAWALTITDLDPIRLGLLFERFLNPERVSMPDFDIDFCETRRGEVIRYVQAKYGRDHVAQIITFGKLKARAVLRHTGRILQMPYGQVDRLSKLVPNHPTDPWDLRRALRDVRELGDLRASDEDVRRLFDLAMQLEGLPRNSSTHAAGVVIGDRPLAELVPMYRDPRSDMPVTQLDMKYVEKAGLVKFDFLGLKTLSVLHKAVAMLARRGIRVDLDRLDWDDPAVYRLLQAGDTVGVFQLESEGMRRTLAAVKPTAFGDIVALVSLYRPGPMDNIPSFGARKNGREAIAYPHPLLEPVLAETYGIIVYQEQVMQAAQVLAGYSLGEADLLRRAMGKKIKAEMDAQRGRFVEGAGAQGIGAAKANELFDLIDKFAGYGFNKSHAAAYALLAYQTAWLKAHYPHEFFAASMCFELDQSEKLAVFVDDMRRAGVALLPPCVNHSEAEFSVEATDDGHAVRYALAGLKNVSERAMEGLAAERRRAGPFASLDDFAGRLEPQLLNRRQVESLAAAGAFDALHADRAAVHGAAETMLAIAAASAASRSTGQVGLFGDDAPCEGQGIRLAAGREWTRGERMAAEKEAFGFYFSAHPVGAFREIAAAHGAVSHAALADLAMVPDQRRPAVMAAMIEGANRRQSRKGREFVMADFSDQSGQFGASCFEEGLGPKLVEWAAEGRCLLLQVELDSNGDDQPPRVTVRGAQPLDALSSSARMTLRCDVEDPGALAQLADLLPRASAARGEVLARLRLDGGRSATLRLGRDFALDSALAERLHLVPGLANIAMSARAERTLRLVE